MGEAAIPSAPEGREQDLNELEAFSLGFSGSGFQEGSPMTSSSFPLGPSSPSPDACLILGARLSLGACSGLIYHQLGQQGRSPRIHSTQCLLKMKAFSSKVRFARQQGGRGGEECTVDEAKGRWPEGRAGRQSGVSSDSLLPRTEAGL